MRLLKRQVLLRLVNSYIVYSPQPANLSYLWNFGSLLGICLVLQILTGIFLAMHYVPNIDLAFASTEHQISKYIARCKVYIKNWFILKLYYTVTLIFFNTNVTLASVAMFLRTTEVKHKNNLYLLINNIAFNIIVTIVTNSFNKLCSLILKFISITGPRFF